MQVNQNVNAANFLLVSSQACNPTESKADADSKVAFASYLQGASANQTATTVSKVHNESDISTEATESQNREQDYLKKNTSVSKASENDKTSATDSAESRNTANKSNRSENKDTTEAKKTSEEDNNTVEEADTVTTPEDVEADDSVEMVLGKLEGLSEEELEGVLATISNLLQNVMEQFNLTFEELSAQLEEFGMEMTDLLNQEGLKSFFLQMNDAEVSDLLVDEELNMQLQAFMNSVNEPLSELQAQIPDMDVFVGDEQIQQLIENHMVSEESTDEAFVVRNTQNSEMVMSEDEPEVIVKEQRVLNQNTAKNSDADQPSENQTEQQSSKSTMQETATVTETLTGKQPVFENPILQGIQNAMNQVEGVVVPEQSVQQTDIVRQVVEQVRLNMNQQTTSLELQLYPEHLGRIQINVVSKEGVMTASIVAETEAAKQAIEAGLLNLKEAMEQHELKVEAIEVMVSTTGFEKGDEQQSSSEGNQASNTRRKIDLSELNDDIPLEDEAELERMKATGSSVSYMA